jgi:hypothetical protein
VDVDEGLDIVEVNSPTDRAAAELAERMAQAILTSPAGYLTKSQLRVAVGGHSATQKDALVRLAQDPRVVMQGEKVPAKDGRLHDAQVWKSAQNAPEALL